MNFGFGLEIGGEACGVDDVFDSFGGEDVKVGGYDGEEDGSGLSAAVVVFSAEESMISGGG